MSDPIVYWSAHAILLGVGAAFLYWLHKHGREVKEAGPVSKAFTRASEVFWASVKLLMLFGIPLALAIAFPVAAIIVLLVIIAWKLGG